MTIPTTTTPVIRCRGLTKRYGRRAVVDDLDLEVERGELFGFLGPNGAGKTTTIRMLLGLVKPDAGQASVFGSPVPCPARLGEIGALIEEPAFYPWLSGRTNLTIVADSGPVPASGAIDRVLELTGLGDAGRKPVKAYSQGMRQRLGIAVAMLRDPALVVLDEPANGLDPNGIRDLRELLRHLSTRGITVFLSSHLLGEVEQVCDRVSIIDQGRLLSVGRLDQVGGEHQQVAVTVQPDETTKARAALGRWPVTSEQPGRLMVDGADGRAVNQALVGAGIYASSLTAQHASLEDRFLAVVEGARRASVAS